MNAFYIEGKVEQRLSSEVSMEMEKTGQRVRVQRSNSTYNWTCWEVGIGPTYGQVSGWIQEDDQQRGRQAVVGFGAVSLDAHQRLWLETEHSRSHNDLTGPHKPVGPGELLPGPACQAWPAALTTPVWGGASLVQRLPMRTTRTKWHHVTLAVTRSLGSGSRESRVKSEPKRFRSPHWSSAASESEPGRSSD